MMVYNIGNSTKTVSNWKFTLLILSYPGLGASTKGPQFSRRGLMHRSCLLRQVPANTLVVVCDVAMIIIPSISISAPHITASATAAQ